MSSFIETEYISVGANRHSAAADWSNDSKTLAFGADQNVAIWHPLDDVCPGIFALLRGHADKVNAVKFLSRNRISENEQLISGSADGEIRVWKKDLTGETWNCVTSVKAHEGAVNCLATLECDNIFGSGSADASIKLWTLQDNDIRIISHIRPNPRFIPLTLVIGAFAETTPTDAIFLAAGGTRNDIQIYSIQNLSKNPSTSPCATLAGHEGWIRSLALRQDDNGELLLASASHDKYVRLWKFSRGDVSFLKKPADLSDAGTINTTLTAKVQTVSVPGYKYSITFEALLLGHEDWVYSAAWSPNPKNSQLLTASADGSLAIWEPDPVSGIWVSASRLGEISGQKGATTATGSAGGFWNGLWSPNGQAVTCLGRTGSWRLWQFDETLQYWVEKSAVGGHVGPVNGLSWPADGSYLLTTSSDQTTRLHAEWRRSTKRTWHEFSRPQIHGYDINCIASSGSHQFSSGADEKLLRVFDEPKAVANMLARLCSIDQPTLSSLPDTAAMPVLGLSNKAMDKTQAPQDSDLDGTPADMFHTDGAIPSLQDLESPPTEDILSRHTLWPEREKLYGHGYEISEAASNSNILATACKASSLEHAVIRLYDTASWNEIRPSLAAHSLTVTRLAWSQEPDDLLLSVGRDRQWAVFQRSEDGSRTWKLFQSNLKAHSRMILDAVWSPSGVQRFFATAGRDKLVKIWYQEAPGHRTDFTLAQTISRRSAVTALSITCDIKSGYTCLAAGEDDGSISVHILDMSKAPSLVKTVELDTRVCPTKSVNRLGWRPNFLRYQSDGPGHQLAIAAADNSTRIVRIDLEAVCANLGKVACSREISEA